MRASSVNLSRIQSCLQCFEIYTKVFYDPRNYVGAVNKTMILHRYAEMNERTHKLLKKLDKRSKALELREVKK